MLIKVALRREDDGTPIGHPAPTYFLCPCGTHVPVYDSQGNRVNHHPQPFVCAKCGQRFDIDGYLLARAENITWTPTTEEHYYDMLGVLPPASYGAGGAFQVGEPMNHKNGRPTFASFKIENGIYYESAEALTFREFAAEVRDATCCYGD